MPSDQSTNQQSSAAIGSNVPSSAVTGTESAKTDETSAPREHMGFEGDFYDNERGVRSPFALRKVAKKGGQVMTDLFKRSTAGGGGPSKPSESGVSGQHSALPQYKPDESGNWVLER